MNPSRHVHQRARDTKSNQRARDTKSKSAGDTKSKSASARYEE